ncbi:MAG: hypothetical protein ACKPEN_01645 [Planktothrix sp.]|uniref:hypothetical protein n=1 Tax=Planktothrix sp. TaxID=3088171 RepID=UPI0038D3E3D2
MLTKAKTTDMATLGLASFNISLLVHNLVADWRVTLILVSGSFPVALIFLVANEEGKNSSFNQLVILNCLICSVLGALMTWMI